MEEYWDNKGFTVLVDTFKPCTLTVATDGPGDMLIHCLKPNCAAGLDQP